MQSALEYLADPRYPRFIESSCNRSERGLHQPLGRAANLRCIEIEHRPPVVPAPGPAPDVPHVIVESLQLSACGVGHAIDALSSEILTSISRAYEAAAGDHDVRAVLMTGARRGFCAGADIHVMDGANLESFRGFSSDVDIDTAVMFENEAATTCFVSADQQEGLQAFLEKRKPRWSGC